MEVLGHKIGEALRCNRRPDPYEGAHCELLGSGWHIAGGLGMGLSTSTKDLAVIGGCCTDRSRGWAGDWNMEHSSTAATRAATRDCVAQVSC